MSYFTPVWKKEKMKKIRVLTVPEARTLLDVSDKTVYRMLADGRLTSYRKDGRAGPGNPHAITLDSVLRNLS